MANQQQDGLLNVWGNSHLIRFYRRRLDQLPVAVHRYVGLGRLKVAGDQSILFIVIDLEVTLHSRQVDHLLGLVGLGRLIRRRFRLFCEAFTNQRVRQLFVLNVEGGQSDEIEVTVLASEAKEFTVGLADNGTFCMSGNWKADDEAQTVLRTARDDGEPRAFKSLFKDGSSSSFLGLVTQFTWDAAPNGTVNGTFNVRITGAVSFDLPPVTP